MEAQRAYQMGRIERVYGGLNGGILLMSVLSATGECAKPFWMLLNLRRSVISIHLARRG